MIHAVEHDLAGAALLDFVYPVDGATPGVAHRFATTGILKDKPIPVDPLGVDADDDALVADAARNLADQLRTLQGSRIDRDFICTRSEYCASAVDAVDATGDAKGNIQQLGDAADPAAFNDSAHRTGFDIVKDEFVGTSVAVALG